MKKIIISLLVVLVLVQAAAAEEPAREEAGLALNTSYQHIEEMTEANFSVSRVSDMLAEARQQFEAQSALEKMNKTPNYKPLIEKAEEIAKLRRQAFEISDEINALELTLKETENINKTAIQEIIDLARKELGDERYEKAKADVDTAYKKISEEQALSTKVAFFLETARKNILDFLAANWIIISSSAAAITALLVLFHGKLIEMKIKKKIRRLDTRRTVLNDMIKALQHEYFELGRISEGTYKVKIEKYKEMLRDIDRLKPLLREELEARRGVLSKLKGKR